MSFSIGAQLPRDRTYHKEEGALVLNCTTGNKCENATVWPKTSGDDRRTTKLKCRAAKDPLKNRRTSQSKIGPSIKKLTRKFRKDPWVGGTSGCNVQLGDGTCLIYFGNSFYGSWKSKYTRKSIAQVLEMSWATINTDTFHVRHYFSETPLSMNCIPPRGAIAWKLNCCCTINGKTWLQCAWLTSSKEAVGFFLVMIEHEKITEATLSKTCQYPDKLRDLAVSLVPASLILNGVSVYWENGIVQDEDQLYLFGHCKKAGIIVAKVSAIGFPDLLSYDTQILCREGWRPLLPGVNTPTAIAKSDLTTFDLQYGSPERAKGTWYLPVIGIKDGLLVLQLYMSSTLLGPYKKLCQGAQNVSPRLQIGKPHVFSSLCSKTVVIIGFTTGGLVDYLEEGYGNCGVLQFASVRVISREVVIAPLHFKAK